LGGIATPVGTKEKGGTNLAAQHDAFELAHDAVFLPKTRAATISFRSAPELDHHRIYPVGTRINP
jgi:hypothetical protein